MDHTLTAHLENVPSTPFCCDNTRQTQLNDLVKQPKRTQCGHERDGNDFNNMEIVNSTDSICSKDQFERNCKTLYW